MIELSLGDPPAKGDIVDAPVVVAHDFDIPIVVTPEVQLWIQYFLGPGRPMLQCWRQRLPQHGVTIQNELQRANLPKDLLYVALVESGLNPQARSRLGAVGMWQFLPDTGRAFGLTVNEEKDERTDVARSTWAAVKYLGELHRRFDDWELALTAYNGGPTMLSDLLRKNNAKTLHDVSAQLSPETRNFVPKILAVAILDRYAHRYGLDE